MCLDTTFLGKSHPFPFHMRLKQAGNFENFARVMTFSVVKLPPKQRGSGSRFRVDQTRKARTSLKSIRTAAPSCPLTLTRRSPSYSIFSTSQLDIASAG